MAKTMGQGLCYGLIGDKLSHSHSPALHALLADYPYELFEMEASVLGTFLQREELGGVNVTIPYKKAVLPFCQTASETARRIGSVNTMVRKGGAWHGYNTDYDGFLRMLSLAAISLTGKKVLILGSGGTSATAQQAAKDQAASEVIVVSRKGEHTYANIQRHSDAQALINTTPVGMSPDIEKSPVSLAHFPHLEAVVDVIYNPLQTALLRQAEQRGIRHTNGLPMLVYQAVRASELFTGASIPEAKAAKALQTLRQMVRNIVLIGMPGAGKTVVGKALAAIMQRECIDTDALIVQKAGMSIAEIFAKYGEKAFREMESSVVADVSKKSGVILTMGGGVVLSQQNIALLRQNGRLYWLQRPLSQLARKGRPLSIDIEAMYAQRKPLYQSASDAQMINDGVGVRETAEKIREDFDENIGH